MLESFLKIKIPYVRHYNPRFVYFLHPFFTAVYIVERLVLQTIYVLNKEILQFLGLKSSVYNQEQPYISYKASYETSLKKAFESRKIGLHTVTRKIHCEYKFY